ncbi:MAG: hypothetical protein R3D66_03625 [Alphaproteobacteria bacterium]
MSVDHMAETMAQQAPNAIEQAIKRIRKTSIRWAFVNSKNFELHSVSHERVSLRYELGRLGNNPPVCTVFASGQPRIAWLSWPFEF